MVKKLDYTKIPNNRINPIFVKDEFLHVSCPKCHKWAYNGLFRHSIWPISLITASCCNQTSTGFVKLAEKRDFEVELNIR